MICSVYFVRRTSVMVTVKARGHIITLKLIDRV